MIYIVSNKSIKKQFKQGLYKLIIENKKALNKKNFIIYVSSFLALGKINNAQKIFNKYVDNKFIRKKDFIYIIKFSPLFLFKNISYFKVPSIIKFLLYKKFNYKKKKYYDFKDIVNFTRTNNNELYLFKSNLFFKKNLHKIKLLNRFINKFNILELHLLNKKKKLSVNNLSVPKIKKFYSKPLISIIVTTFNSERLIENCLLSLINQTYSNIEIIVIDDASFDSTEAVVKKLIKKDNRIKYYKLNYNVGTYAAKNIAINYATGEFITCHDSDDFAHPEKIENQAKPLIRFPWLVFTISYWVRLTNKGIFYARQTFPLLRLNPTSLMFRKNIVINKVGYWDSVKIGADSEFYYRLKLVFGRFRMFKIKKPLTIGTYREESLTTNKETGFITGAIPKIRYDYWESWMKWHLTLKEKGLIPKIPKNYLKKREFYAPKKILVNSKKIYKNLNLKTF